MHSTHSDTYTCIRYLYGYALESTIHCTYLHYIEVFEFDLDRQLAAKVSTSTKKTKEHMPYVGTGLILVDAKDVPLSVAGDSLCAFVKLKPPQRRLNGTSQGSWIRSIGNKVIPLHIAPSSSYSSYLFPSLLRFSLLPVVSLLLFCVVEVSPVCQPTPDSKKSSRHSVLTTHGQTFDRPQAGRT